MINEFRFALRGLLKHSGFTAMVDPSIALRYE